MKKAILSIIVVMIGLSAYSQFPVKGLFIELRYPVPAGNNFLNNNFLGGHGYVGIADAGTEYYPIRSGNFGLGVAYNISILRYPETEVNLTIHTPRIVAAYTIAAGKFIIMPQAAIGYSMWRIKFPDLDFNDSGGTISNEQGLSLEGSARLIYHTDKSFNWFIQFGYEFIRLGEPEMVENSAYNRNIQFLYPGLGLVWYFGV